VGLSVPEDRLKEFARVKAGVVFAFATPLGIVVKLSVGPH